MFKKFIIFLVVVCMLLSCMFQTVAATDQKRVEKPDFSPRAGAYDSEQTVELSCTTAGATIRFTLDGSAPISSSAVYSAPITISKTTTVRAYATSNGMRDSNIATSVYIIKKPAPNKVIKPTFSPAAGTYDSAQTIELSCTTAGATILYTLDGSAPISTSTIYSGPVTITETTTIKTFAIKKGMRDSDTAEATYTIVPKPDPWTLVWEDEFDGTSVDTEKWNLVDKGDGFGNNEAQYYKPENAVVQDGKLLIQAKKEAYGGCNYTSAKLFTQGKADWKYGKFEARMKLPEGQGFWPAFWMMPANDVYGGWAASGEIDIMEARGRLTDVVGGTLHYGGAWPNNKYTGASYNFTDGQSISGFHTYTVEWEPGEFRWYVDGELYQTQNNWNTKGANGEEKYSFPAPFDQDFYLIMNLAVGGNFDGGLLPDDAMFPAQMEVDYVKAYELTGRPYKTPVEPSTPVDPLPAGARVPDATGNLVNDINFELGIKDNAEGVDADFGNVWNFVHNAAFGGVAAASIEAIEGKNYAKVDVSNTGTQPYSVQLEQLTTLGKGRWYTYSFDAKAGKSRTLSTKLGGGPTGGWAAYSDPYTANLTTDFQHFEYTFQMTRDSDILTRIEYNCATDTGAVWIGNVRVEETAPPQVDYNASKDPLPVSGNYIYNGAFDKYTIDRMAYWNVTKTGADAVISVPESTRELTADITDGGATADAVTVDQKGLKLAAGNGYKLSFNARAAADRTIRVKIVGKDETVSYLPEKEIALATAGQPFEVPFKMEAASDPESQLVFMLGGNNSDVFIDDVSLIKTSIDYSNINMYPMKNGDFSKGLESWENWVGEGGSAAISAENGEAKVAVASVGNKPWATQFYQTGFNLEKDMEYIVAFDASSTAARNIEISLENSSYTRFFTKIMPVGPDKTHFEYTFRMPISDLLTFKFLLGRTDDAAGALGAHDIFIDNVVCEVKDAKFLTSVVLNGQFKTGLDPWSVWAGDGGAANLSAVNGEMRLAVNSAGPNSWSVQAFQEGLKFENGQNYRLSFKARADAARMININVGKALTADPWYTAFMPMKTADLTNTMQEYVYEFVMSEATYDNGKIVFEAGNVAGSNTATNIYIDDVAINKVAVPMEKVAVPTISLASGTYLPGQEVTISCATAGAATRYTTDGTAPTAASTAYTGAIALSSSATIKAAAFKDGMLASDAASATYVITTSPELLGNIIVNGTFDVGTDAWVKYTNDGSNAALSVEDGKLKVNFPNYDGWFIWSTQLYQQGLALEAGKTYTLSFELSATIPKAISFDIEKASDYNVKYLNPQGITPGLDMTVYTYEFTVSSAENNAKLVFLLGSNNVPGELFVSHSIFIDNIILKEK